MCQEELEFKNKLYQRMQTKIGHCNVTKYCAECKENCVNEKGYCVVTKYCEECGECKC